MHLTQLQYLPYVIFVSVGRAVAKRREYRPFRNMTDTRTIVAVSLASIRREIPSHNQDAQTVRDRPFCNSSAAARGIDPRQRAGDVIHSTMLIGYMRVSTADQSTNLQRDALIANGVAERDIYMDKASGRNDDRPGLEACLRALRAGDTLIVWKLDRLGRSLRHLVATVQGLAERDVAFKVLTGHGADIDTGTAAGKLVFGIFAALAEFERELISERTRAGLAAAKARGRKGGRKPKLSATEIAGVKARLAADVMLDRQALARKLGVHRSTLWRALEQGA